MDADRAARGRRLALGSHGWRSRYEPSVLGTAARDASSGIPGGSSQESEARAAARGPRCPRSSLRPSASVCVRSCGIVPVNRPAWTSFVGFRRDPARRPLLVAINPALLPLIRFLLFVHIPRPSAATMPTPAVPRLTHMVISRSLHAAGKTIATLTTLGGTVELAAALLVSACAGTNPTDARTTPQPDVSPPTWSSTASLCDSSSTGVAIASAAAAELPTSDSPT